MIAVNEKRPFTDFRRGCFYPPLTCLLNLTRSGGGIGSHAHFMRGGACSISTGRDLLLTIGCPEKLRNEFAVAFQVVYMREPHTSDVWQDPDNLDDHVVFPRPKSMTERSAIGPSCVVKLGIHFLTVVDSFENTTEHYYVGWPDRLYAIDLNGRIAYEARTGPFGFKLGELPTRYQGSCHSDEPLRLKLVLQSRVAS